jgi:hypothetical protein
MSATPAFASVPVLLIANVTAANTNRDGTGTIVDLVALTPVPTLAPTAGRRIDRLRVKATGQVATSVAKIYVFDGTTYRLYTEVLIPAITPSTTAKAFEVEVPVFDLTLQLNEKLGADVSVVPTSGSVLVMAFGGELT